MIRSMDKFLKLWEVLVSRPRGAQAEWRRILLTWNKEKNQLQRCIDNRNRTPISTSQASLALTLVALQDDEVISRLPLQQPRHYNS